MITVLSQRLMSRFAPVLAVCLLAVTLTGCAMAPKVEHNKRADFTHYHRFAVLPLPQTTPPGDPGLMLRIGEALTNSATQTLIDKGYQPVERENADFVIHMRGSSIPRVDVRSYGYSPVYVYGRRGPAVYVGSSVDVNVKAYDERTLAVEIFDNRSHEAVWTGWITREATGPVKTKNVVKAAKRILENFPPKPNT